MFKEFKDFAMRGNVIDLAVGVVIGGAFNTIVASMVADIFMPIIGLITGGLDFSGLSYKFINAELKYGKFIQSIFQFVLTAFALFLFVKGVNRMKRKQAAAPAVPAAPPADIVLLTEIRDLLKN